MNIDQNLCVGCFGHHTDESDAYFFIMEKGNTLQAPMSIAGDAVYRFRVDIKNIYGDGIVHFSLTDQQKHNSSQIPVDCPIDSELWHTFDVDVVAFHTRGNLTVEISKPYESDGSVMLKNISFEKMPPQTNQFPVPRIIATHKSQFSNSLPIKQYKTLMETEMDDLKQQNWRGKDIVSKKDEKGIRCQSMNGDRSIIFVPVTLEPNTTYKCVLDLRKESGNGKLFCNFYANKNFDFPHIALVCETGWKTYEIQLKTKDFPINLPINLRLWRYPGGTGSILVKRIAIECLDKPIIKTDKITPSPPPQLQKEGLPYSCYPKQPTKVFFISDLGDEEEIQSAFKANNILCETIALDNNNMTDLGEIIRMSETSWVHFHLHDRNTAILPLIQQIRNIERKIVITVWAKPRIPVFDNALLSVFRAVDLALVESQIELTTYRSAGGFNIELWDPDMASVERIRELAIRLGCFEVIAPFFPKNREYVFKRILCVGKAFSVDVIIENENGMVFSAIPFSNCCDFIAAVVRFRPDLLHIHLDNENDELPWRDALSDVRRFLPTMLITVWHSGDEVDRRVTDLKFVADHIFIGNEKTILKYYAESLMGVKYWNPRVPINDVEEFRHMMLDFVQAVTNQREVFLKNYNGELVDLTVFIGTFNRLEQLRRAVETVFSSSGARIIELIINDAGSTDGTQEWLREISQSNRKIVPIFTGKRTSFTQVFNESLQIAKGKYICWLSDDITPDDLALADICSIMDKATPLDLGGFSINEPWVNAHEVRFGDGFYIPTVGCMYTETLRKLGGLNMDYPYYAQDTDLDSRVLRIGGHIIACTNCKLEHDCKNDELRKNNWNKHSDVMGDAKYYFAWRPSEYSYLPYPTFLLRMIDGCSSERVINVVKNIRKHYLNSHIFIYGEIDLYGVNSFLHRASTDKETICPFDIIINITPNKNLLLKPAGKTDTLFAKRLLWK